MRTGENTAASDWRPLDGGSGLQRIKRSVGELEARVDLRPWVSDHYAHLSALAERLSKLGMDDAAIDGHVVGIFEQYRRQLLLSLAEAAEPGAHCG